MVTGAVNYYFKHFNRGWYTGGGLEYDLFSPFGDDATERLLKNSVPFIGSSRVALMGSLNLGWSF